jgi:hypothetical protein
MNPHRLQLWRIKLLRSSGVFLWVALVVHAFLEALSRGDRLSDMRRTLEEIPSELERLFDVMINSLSVPARKRAAEMFRIVGAASGPLPLLETQAKKIQNTPSSSSRESAHKTRGLVVALEWSTALIATARVCWR